MFHFSFTAVNDFLIGVDEVIDHLVEVSSDVVVFNDIHDVEVGLTLGQEFDAFFTAFDWSGLLVLCCLGLVDHCPDRSEGSKSLVLPNLEGLVIDYSWLDDLLSWEDAPSHSINLVVVHVL